MSVLRQNYQVNEIFDSVQGEGILTGTPATFVRLQGCTVGCEWCDTKYTWLKGGERMTVDEIVSLCHETHVVITGGEPTLYDLDSLFLQLSGRRKYTQLETSGQNPLKGTYRPDWITLSPKYTMDFKFADVYWVAADEVKFVVDEHLSLNEMLTIAEVFHDKRGGLNSPYFVLMPEGSPPKPENVDVVLDWLKDRRVRKLNSVFTGRVRFGDRMQYRIGVR